MSKLIYDYKYSEIDCVSFKSMLLPMQSVSFINGANDRNSGFPSVQEFD
jgi:hypothetical protein